MKILPKITAKRPASQQALEDSLIRQEAIEGGKLFGPIAKGHDRQFFCLDEHRWVWHESWSDKNGVHNLTTRYEIRPNGVFKVKNGGTYQGLSSTEAANLLQAAKLYAAKILPNYQAALNK